MSISTNKSVAWVGGLVGRSVRCCFFFFGLGALGPVLGPVLGVFGRETAGLLNVGQSRLKIVIFAK